MRSARADGSATFGLPMQVFEMRRTLAAPGATDTAIAGLTGNPPFPGPVRNGSYRLPSSS